MALPDVIERSPASAAMWRHARSIRIADLRAQLTGAINRRDTALAAVYDQFTAACREIWAEFPGPDNPTAHLLVVRECVAAGQVWAATDADCARAVTRIRAALAAQDAS